MDAPSTLPTEPAERKTYPIATGVLDYFPKAIAAIAQVSLAGNEQHHPGKPLHWDRSKSTDEADALMRHFLERGKLDSDGQRHSAKVAWRALALLEKELEREQHRVSGAPGAVICCNPLPSGRPEGDIGLQGTRVCGNLAPTAIDRTGAYCSLVPGHGGVHKAHRDDDLHRADYARWTDPQPMAPRPGGAF